MKLTTPYPMIAGRSGSCAVRGTSVISVKGEEGSIFVPNYKAVLPGFNSAPTMDCTWAIQVPPNKVIKFQFQRLSNMNNGYLEVKDGRYGNGIELFKFCELSFRKSYAVLPRSIYSSGQFLRFRLIHKDLDLHSLRWNGILVSYKAVTEGKINNDIK